VEIPSEGGQKKGGRGKVLFVIRKRGFTEREKGLSTYCRERFLQTLEIFLKGKGIARKRRSLRKKKTLISCDSLGAMIQLKLRLGGKGKNPRRKRGRKGPTPRCAPPCREGDSPYHLMI